MERYRYKIKTLSNIINAFGFSELKNRADIIMDLLEDHARLDVAVLGQFKAGKSTLVNRLTGKDLLPSGVIPVTSVITTIAYGPVEKATLLYADQKAAETDVSAIDQFITERENPENKKGVLAIDIETPALSELQGIRFIDTPGLGSIYRSSTDLTLNWIPGSGVVIVLINSSQPGSDADISLIRETLKHSPHVIPVISKVDLLSDAQQAEVREFINRSLKNEFGREFRVFDYSAMKNARRYRSLLLEEGLVPLLRDAITVKADIIDHKVNTLLEECLGYLRIAGASSVQKENKRNEFREYILDEKTRETIIRTDLRLIASHYRNQTRTILEEKIRDKYRNPVAKKLEVKFQERVTEWKGNISQRTQMFESWIKVALADALLEVSAGEHRVALALLTDAREHFSSYMKSLHENLDRKMLEVFNLSLPEKIWDEPLPGVSRPDIFVRPAFDIPFDMLGPAFPMFLFHRWLKRYFRQQIASEVEKNLSRLVSGLTENVNAGISGIEKQSFDLIHSEILLIEKLLSSSIPDTKKISESIQLLESLKPNLIKKR